MEQKVLLQFADNEDLQLEWREAKRRNKIKVASFLKEKTGYVVNPNAMFDVQVGFLEPSSVTFHEFNPPSGITNCILQYLDSILN